MCLELIVQKQNFTVNKYKKVIYNKSYSIFNYQNIISKKVE